ncbi:MAG: HNH endonuclease [Nitrospinae bacterium]|nr:HNH endonuclease [Nitrospinota bacterium]
MSRYSSKSYLEAHHLIPISLQPDFEIPLDIVHNFFCFCPHCHNAVHVACDILTQLVKNRPILPKGSLVKFLNFPIP